MANLASICFNQIKRFKNLRQSLNGLNKSLNTTIKHQPQINIHTHTLYTYTCITHHRPHTHTHTHIAHHFIHCWSFKCFKHAFKPPLIKIPLTQKLKSPMLKLCFAAFIVVWLHYLLLIFVTVNVVGVNLFDSLFDLISVFLFPNLVFILIFFYFPNSLIFFDFALNFWLNLTRFVWCCLLFVPVWMKMDFRSAKYSDARRESRYDICIVILSLL